MQNSNLRVLFDARSTVAVRLGEVIKKGGYTKSGVCADTGISRPTLDKLLHGELAHQQNFEKHMEKLLNYFRLTANELLGGMNTNLGGNGSLRQELHIDLENLSHVSGVSIENLNKIEASEDVSLADLRDVAFCLGTSVNGVRGKGYFQTQIADSGDSTISFSITSPSLKRCWGHIGLRLVGQAKFMWFPITEYTERMAKQLISQKFMVVECMDNSLLLIRQDAIEEINLLSKKSKRSSAMDWDSRVNMGTIPAVVYEAFEDYMSYKGKCTDPATFNLSEKMIAAMDAITAKEKLDPDDFARDLKKATIFYPNGKEQSYELDFNSLDDAASLIFLIKNWYEYNNLLERDLLRLHCGCGMDTFINLENTAMMKLPLALVEELILADLGQGTPGEVPCGNEAN